MGAFGDEAGFVGGIGALQVVAGVRERNSQHATG